MVVLARRGAVATFGASSVARHVEVIVRYARVTVAKADAGFVLNLLSCPGMETVY